MTHLSVGHGTFKLSQHPKLSWIFHNISAFLAFLTLQLNYSNSALFQLTRTVMKSMIIASHQGQQAAALYSVKCWAVMKLWLSLLHCFGVRLQPWQAISSDSTLNISSCKYLHLASSESYFQPPNSNACTSVFNRRIIYLVPLSLCINILLI